MPDVQAELPNLPIGNYSSRDENVPLRVLHIDDEPDLREIVAISFSLDSDFVLRSCASGKEGLAAASEYRPDLILLDVVMPFMDGMVTLGHLQENPRTADIPVVLMTARDDEFERWTALGAAGVICKPFDPTTLAALARSHIRQAGDVTPGATLQRRARGGARAIY
jgi:DNA-binding response OmpR family regulator